MYIIKITHICLLSGTVYPIACGLVLVSSQEKLIRVGIWTRLLGLENQKGNKPLLMYKYNTTRLENKTKFVKHVLADSYQIFGHISKSLAAPSVDCSTTFVGGPIGLVSGGNVLKAWGIPIGPKLIPIFHFHPLRLLASVPHLGKDFRKMF